MERKEAEAVAQAVLEPDVQPSQHDAWRVQGLLWMAAGALAGAGLATLADGLPVVWGFVGSLTGAALALVVRFFQLRR